MPERRALAMQGAQASHGLPISAGRNWNGGKRPPAAAPAWLPFQLTSRERAVEKCRTSCAATNSSWNVWPRSQRPEVNCGRGSAGAALALPGDSCRSREAPHAAWLDPSKKNVTGSGQFPGFAHWRPRAVQRLRGQRRCWEKGERERREREGERQTGQQTVHTRMYPRPWGRTGSNSNKRLYIGPRRLPTGNAAGRKEERR